MIFERVGTYKPRWCFLMCPSPYSGLFAAMFVAILLRDTGFHKMANDTKTIQIVFSSFNILANQCRYSGF